MEKRKKEDILGHWGLLAAIYLYECSPDLIREPAAIKKFIIELCQVINMKRFGEVLVERFGKDSLKGYSAMQFIETSSITAHFDETENRAFIDVFSCQDFNLEEAVQFCQNFFHASYHQITVIDRQ